MGCAGTPALPAVLARRLLFKTRPSTDDIYHGGKMMTDDLMPWNDTWFDIGGEG
jgi:hypothetical protein